MSKKIIISILACLLIFTGCGKKDEVENFENNDKNLLKENLNIEFNAETKLSELINDNSNIEVLNGNELIDTSMLGEQEIVIKYLEDNKEKEYKFTIKVVDSESPVIQHINEFTTTVGSEIDLLENVLVIDNSNETIKATIEGKYDFNVAGTYYLTYVAVDSSNNKTVESFVLYVNEKTQNDTNVTYYRYREKIYNNYECGTYNCSYVDYNDTKAANVVFKSSSPCGGGHNEMINTPCPLGKTCIQVMTERYKIKNNVCYDSAYIITDPKTYTKTNCSADEIKIGGYCHKIESKGIYPAGCNSSECIKFNESSPCGGGFNEMINTPCPLGKTCIQVMTERYKKENDVCYDSTYIIVHEESTEKTVCGTGEINIDGYCHSIESTGTTTCDAGYTKINDTTCAKNVSKTCTKTCTTESWGEWSEWTTNKISPSDKIQVEIKKN